MKSSACQIFPQGFAKKRRNKIKSVFWSDMRDTENSSQVANVRQRRALQRPAKLGGKGTAFSAIYPEYYKKRGIAEILKKIKKQGGKKK